MHTNAFKLKTTLNSQDFRIFKKQFMTAYQIIQIPLWKHTGLSQSLHLHLSALLEGHQAVPEAGRWYKFHQEKMRKPAKWIKTASRNVFRNWILSYNWLILMACIYIYISYTQYIYNYIYQPEPRENVCAHSVALSIAAVVGCLVSRAIQQ